MTPQQSQIAYPIILSVFEGRASAQSGADQLHSELSINKHSARYLIDVYACLRNGVVFKRALSAADMSYLLLKIGEVRREDLSTALDALKLHIAYREQSGVSQRGNRRILERETIRLESMPSNSTTPAISLGEAERDFLLQVNASLQDSKESRQLRLSKARRAPRRIARLIYVYERNADVVAEVLLRAHGNCERCKSKAPFLRKTDDTPYLEVHHVIPLAENGEDSVDNAIALCPNCHRYSHHGHIA